MIHFSRKFALKSIEGKHEQRHAQPALPTVTARRTAALAEFLYRQASCRGHREMRQEIRRGSDRGRACRRFRDDSLMREAADLFYHLIVLLEAGDATLAEVMTNSSGSAEGLAEKARKRPRAERDMVSDMDPLPTVRSRLTPSFARGMGEAARRHAVDARPRRTSTTAGLNDRFDSTRSWRSTCPCRACSTSMSRRPRSLHRATTASCARHPSAVYHRHAGASPSARARPRASCALLARWPNHPKVDLITDRRLSVPERVLEREG